MLNKKDNTMKVFLALIMVMFLSTILTGCPKKNTSQTLFASLDSATAVYNSTHDLLTQLHNNGKLSEEQEAKAVEVMTEAESSLKAAADALDLYVRSNTDADKLSFEAKILTVNQLVIKITEIIGGQLE